MNNRKGTRARGTFLSELAKIIWPGKQLANICLDPEKVTRGKIPLANPVKLELFLGKQMFENFVFWSNNKGVYP